MRRFDKKKSIKKANLLSEQRYLKDKLNESFHDVDGTPIGVDRNHMPIQSENTNVSAIEAVSMLVSHLYHADNTINTSKAFDVLSKNPGLVNLLPLSKEDVDALVHLSTVFKDNESNEKLQRIINIVKSHI